MAFSPSELLRPAGWKFRMRRTGWECHPKPKSYFLAKKSNYIFRSDYITGGVFPKIPQRSSICDVPSPVRAPRPPINPVAREERERERERERKRERKCSISGRSLNFEKEAVEQSKFEIGPTGFSHENSVVASALWHQPFSVQIIFIRCVWL